jgi:hypothetical protein
VLDLSPPFLPPFTGYRRERERPGHGSFFAFWLLDAHADAKKNTAKMKKKDGRDRKERPATSDQQQNPKGD